MSAAIADRVLWRSQTRDDAELRLTTKPYRGTEYVSLRTYWKTPAGEWVPTKKGCTFAAELVPEIIEALQEVA
jgi:hypothetical protein